jgi:3-oxoacyl-[acyl-carrier protein] reductase
MDLQLKDQYFIICGAGSGFGKAVALRIVNEGARVLAIARRRDTLLDLQEQSPAAVDTSRRSFRR